MNMKQVLYLLLISIIISLSGCILDYKDGELKRVYEVKTFKGRPVEEFTSNPFYTWNHPLEIELTSYPPIIGGFQGRVKVANGGEWLLIDEVSFNGMSTFEVSGKSKLGYCPAGSITKLVFTHLMIDEEELTGKCAFYNPFWEAVEQDFWAVRQY